MKHLLLCVLLLAPALAGQEQKKEEPKQEFLQKLFVLKHADPRQIERVLAVFNARTNSSIEMRTLSVSAAPATITAIEEIVNRLDVPSAAAQNLDLVAYLLIGSQSADTPAGPLPKDLDPVVAQLKNAFADKSFRLMDALIIRTRTGRQASVTGSGGGVTVGGASQPIHTAFSISSANVGSNGRIQINGLRALAKVPTSVTASGVQHQNLEISTDVDLKEGQKVVVGKSSMNTGEALFVVLVVNVIQ